MKNVKRLRIIMICLAAAAILIPVAIAGTTGYGFGETAANIFMSLSIAFVIGSILVGLDHKQKEQFFYKIGICVALLIVMAKLWL